MQLDFESPSATMFFMERDQFKMMEVPCYTKHVNWFCFVHISFMCMDTHFCVADICRISDFRLPECFKSALTALHIYRYMYYPSTCLFLHDEDAISTSDCREPAPCPVAPWA